jgi:glutamate racemase
MRVDLLAGTLYSPAPTMPCAPKIMVFDSGLGGLTVFAEVAKARPDARFVYAADDAGFPYGRLAEAALVARVLAVMERLIEVHAPDLVVIACNTASTMVLKALRARFSVPFVGTVPAIKPAAGLSRSKRISVLATPGAIKSEYTRDLVAAYAGGCRVTLVGAPRLAALAEAELCAGGAAEEEVAAEIAPCFVAEEDGRTDVVALACTHYPLLLAKLRRLAPWPVIWIDPAPAIARRVVQLLGGPEPAREPTEEGEEAVAVFTGGSGVTPALREALAARGLPSLALERFPN